MAAGCYDSGNEEPDGRDAADAPVEGIDAEGDGAYLDCPAPDDMRVSISLRPIIEEYSFASTGEVTDVTREADGSLHITIDFAAPGQDPNEILFQVPIPEGVDVDLHPGEEVEVEYGHFETGTYGSNLTIWKNEETIVMAGTCANNCIHDSLVVFPLAFTLLSGRCEPLPDDLGCVLYERLGYSIRCESGTDEVEVFDHGYVHVPCGPGYHVILGALDRIDERLEPSCFDIYNSHAEMIVIRHGDGLASSGP
jgi:hypothetical protein